MKKLEVRFTVLTGVSKSNYTEVIRILTLETQSSIDSFPMNGLFLYLEFRFYVTFHPKDN